MKKQLAPLVAPVLLAVLCVPLVLVGTGDQRSFAIGWTQVDMHTKVDRWRSHGMRIIPAARGPGLLLHYVNSSGGQIPVDHDDDGFPDIWVDPTATFTAQTTDGVHWTKPVATNLPRGRQDWMTMRVRDIATAGGRYVGIGTQTRFVGGVKRYTGSIFSSRDGVRWREVRHVNEGWVADATTFHDRLIVQGNDGWVSSDGVRFTRDDRVAPYIFEDNPYSNPVRWHGRTIWVGHTDRRKSIITASTVDGTRWNRSTVGTHAVRPYTWNDWHLAATERHLVAFTTVTADDDDLTSTTETYVSTDGRRWRRCVTQRPIYASGITALDDRFVAVGFIGAGKTVEGAMWTSTDGCRWSRERAAPLRDADQLYAVATLGDRLVVVGSYWPEQSLSQDVPLYAWSWSRSS